MPSVRACPSAYRYGDRLSCPSEAFEREVPTLLQGGVQLKSEVDGLKEDCQSKV